ncbi:hypothetical protein [Thiomicrorhabdus xiamenensis]|uniref:Uncharacterized protein n=1 Tax=Thiomicrorhabdus xiamenensis TaxID=2739063 RepID=A0A7D4P3E3_9GAMM|nr:hypothetical protein [Thiomicrorhabdus xiamenensis]QKI88536.1 hypothetical protein HQN79_02575 [Thiomicrorhabdus xiamenensis]
MKQEIPEHVKALAYLYQQSLYGNGATNASYGKQPQGNHYFRNHFNKGGEFEGLRIITVWDKHLEKRFKRYYLHPDDYQKAEAILASHKLIKG